MRIELNRAGIKSLLKAPGVQADVTARAERIRNAAGPGHDTSSVIGINRARATVITVDWAARHAEARDRNLTRSIDAGR